VFTFHALSSAKVGRSLPVTKRPGQESNSPRAGD
jgi:hypothetical protein